MEGLGLVNASAAILVNASAAILVDPSSLEDLNLGIALLFLSQVTKYLNPPTR